MKDLLLKKSLYLLFNFIGKNYTLNFYSKLSFYLFDNPSLLFIFFEIFVFF